MKRLLTFLALGTAAWPAVAGGPVPTEQLTAAKLAGGTIRWMWTSAPSALSYDIIGDALPMTGVENATCRTGEDGDPTDLLFDDPLLPFPARSSTCYAGFPGYPAWGGRTEEVT